jgi:hypothetical protein
LIAVAGTPNTDLVIEHKNATDLAARSGAARQAAEKEPVIGDGLESREGSQK